MSKRTLGSSLPLLGYAFLVAALFLAVRGYQFDTDDQAEHLPQVYQMLDPALYANDYFVKQSNSIFTVRYYYERLVWCVVSTVGLEWGLFLLTFGCIALMAYSFSRIAQEWFGDGWAVLLAPMLALLVFYNFTIGGNHIMYGSLISSTLAKALSAYALLRYVRSQLLSAGVVLGMATLFQPLVGLQLFMVIGVIEVLFRKEWRSTLRFTVPFAIISAFILVPTFARQFGAELQYDKGLYYEVLYRFRNYHHYIPSLFPLGHYLKFFGMLGLGLISYYLTRPNDKGFYVRTVVIGVMGMLMYWLMLEHLHISAIGKLQWFKITVWLAAFSAIMFAGLLGQLLSAFLPFIHFKKLLVPVSLSLCLLVIMVITNSKLLPDRFAGKWMVGNRTFSDLEKMHIWIAQHTATDATVLVSPDDNSFSCQAKRSMPIHFQAIVHEPFFMLPWYEDFREIYGVSIENLKGIDARAMASELYCTRNYRGNRKHIDYRLDRISTCLFSNQLGPELHREGDWVLTEFVPQAMP